MIPKLKVVICLLVMAVILIGAFSAGADSGRLWYQFEKETDAYVFPVTPDKTPDQWRLLKSLEAKIEVCQVPDDILAGMSTEGLIETCLSYPRFGEMMLFNHAYYGFLKQTEYFNGLQELFSRPDAGQKLYELYRNVSFANVLKTDQFPSFRVRYLEYILAQESVLSGLDASTRQDLVKTCIENVHLKMNKYPRVFSIEPTALIAGRILQKDNQEIADLIEGNEALRDFLVSGQSPNLTAEEWGETLNAIENAVR